MIQLRGDTLLAQSELAIMQSVFEPVDYEQLRSFFEQIVATEAGQVVLKRATDSAETMDGAAER